MSMRAPLRRRDERLGLRRIRPMTEDQLSRLPNLFREIVIIQREIDAVCGRPVVPLKEATQLLDRRYELVRHVGRVYSGTGGTSGGGGCA